MPSSLFDSAGVKAKVEAIEHAKGRVLVRTFGYLILSQVVARVLPFMVNALVTRRLTPEEMGVATIHYALVLSITLNSREGFRRASVRGADAAAPGDKGSQGTTTDRQALLVSSLSIPLGILIGLATWVLALNLRSDSQGEAYMLGMKLHVIGACLELSIEPLYVLAQRQLMLPLRVTSETLATLLRCCTTYYFVLHRATHPAVAFGYAQIAYAAAMAVVYLGYYLPSLPLFNASQGGTWFSSDLMNLSASFTVQAFWKLVLAEGEKAALMAYGAADTQGVYGLISNLGSLLVRVVLAPFEESAFLAFSRTQAVGGVTDDSLVLMRGQARLLALLVKLASLGGLVVAAYGSNYSYLLIRILYGTQWSDNTDASSVLGLYSVYVLILAVNGITEAFVHSMSTAAQLRAQNKWLLFFSLVSLALGVYFQHVLGAAGIIAANSVTMVLRICYSSLLIRQHFSKLPEGANMRLWFPPAAVLATLGVIWTTTMGTCWLFQSMVSEVRLAPGMVHVLIGILGLTVFALSVWNFDQHFCEQLSALRRGRPLYADAVEKKET